MRSFAFTGESQRGATPGERGRVSAPSAPGADATGSTRGADATPPACRAVVEVVLAADAEPRGGGGVGGGADPGRAGLGVRPAGAGGCRVRGGSGRGGDPARRALGLPRGVYFWEDFSASLTSRST